MLYNMYSWSIEYFQEKTKELQQIPIYSTEMNEKELAVLSITTLCKACGVLREMKCLNNPRANHPTELVQASS